MNYMYLHVLSVISIRNVSGHLLNSIIYCSFLSLSLHETLVLTCILRALLRAVVALQTFQYQLPNRKSTGVGIFNMQNNFHFLTNRKSE
jgi:hypothetical protein